MPTASQTAHRIISNTALPYISNSSVIDQNPQYLPGSSNILTSLRSYSERRPGFAQAVERAATAFSALKRIFFWERWEGSTPNGGAFIAMACDISAGVAKVYYLIEGVNNSFVLLWTSTSSEPFDFVEANNTVYFGNGTDMKKWNSSTLSGWGITSPAAGPGLTLVAGALNAFTSYCYCYTYGNSSTAHESSPSAISACSGVFSAKNVRVSVTASTDPQVDQIHVYRTPDGGAQDPTLMQEISGSPFANSTTTHDDSTPDTSLSTRVAPAFLRNDPPVPSKGFVAYAGRIWGFADNITYYSGNEEIANGVPQECFPSGLDGNNYPWDKQVISHAPLIDGISVFTSVRIYKVEGDSLDTFRRYTLLEKRGARNRAAVSALGGSVAWLDTSATVWVSDIGEISQGIRPDIAAIDQSKAYISIHISGIYHWIVLLDGNLGLLYVYDLDTQQWMPPWTIPGQSSALGSYETSSGNIDLMVALNGTKLMKLVPGSFQDDGTAYAMKAKTNLFSASASGNPAWKGVMDWVELKTNVYPASQVMQLTDDDPTTGAYVDITSTAEDSPDIIQGANLLTTRYTSAGQLAPQCQLTSVFASWGTSVTASRLYQIDIATHPVGS